MKTYTIEIQGGNTFACFSGETVTGALERQGFKDIAAGCRAGGCGSCKIQILQGEVQHGRLNSIVISSEEISQGFTLACQSFPLSDLAILLPSSDSPSA